jgi:hypothetical protein
MRGFYFRHKDYRLEKQATVVRGRILVLTYVRIHSQDGATWARSGLVVPLILLDIIRIENRVTLWRDRYGV